MINLKFFQTSRYALGSLFVGAAWFFTFAKGPSGDALPQIFAMAMFSLSSLLLGISAISIMSVALLLAAGLIIAMAPSPYWGGHIAGVAGFLLFGIACHMGAHLQRRPAALLWILTAIVTAAFINAVEGLLQWFGLVGELYRWVDEPQGRGEAFGIFRQRNLFATFLCVGSICTVWLVHKRRLTESMAWFLLVILMFAVAASGSRTGLLEVLILASLGVIWRKEHSPAVTRLLVSQLIVLGLALLILSKAASWLEFGFVSGVERAALMGMDARLTIWSNAIDLIAERPWFGWGWRETGYGNYAALLRHQYGGLVDNVHNLPLQIAVEFGLPVSIFFFAVVSRCIFLAKPWRIDVVKADGLIPPASDGHFAWAILLLIVGIHSMLEYPLWYAGFLFLTGLAVGYVLPIQDIEKIDGNYAIWSKLIVRLIAVLLIILALVAWQQYSKILPIYKTPFTKDKEAHRKAVMIALANASDSWLFQAQLDFSTLGLMEVTSQNAVEVRQIAEKLLHYSAEPRVIQPLLLSLWYLNDETAFRFHAERFCYAFPIAFQRWSYEYANHPMFIVAERSAAQCRYTMSE